MLVISRLPGGLRIVWKDGKLSEPVASLLTVDARGREGLFDVTLDPNYAQNHLIYWSYPASHPIESSTM